MVDMDKSLIRPATEHYAMFNHVVAPGLWMWYRQYSHADIESYSGVKEPINHCATVLLSNFREKKDPAVYVRGPVIFTGTLEAAVEENHSVRVHLMARLAFNELQRIEKEGTVV